MGNCDFFLCKYAKVRFLSSEPTGRNGLRRTVREVYPSESCPESSLSSCVHCIHYGRLDYCVSGSADGSCDVRCKSVKLCGR